MSESPLSRDNTASIVARAKAIILKPNEEWPIIAVEPTSVQDVLVKYAIPLAAIGPVCAFIGGQVFGINAIFVTYRPSLLSGISTMVATFVLSLVSIFVLAFIANLLAPKFSGRENYTRAFKLCAYAMTAAWVVGVFQLIPSLGMLAGLLGLYSLYLLYTGVTPMMAVPADKAVGYTVVTVICAIVLNLVAATVVASVTGAFATVGNYGAVEDEVTMTIPGAGQIKTSRENGTSTIEIPGVGTMQVSEDGNTMKIEGTVDGQEFNANVQTDQTGATPAVQ